MRLRELLARSRWVVAVVALLGALSAVSAQAAPVTVYLHYAWVYGATGATADAVAVIDDSILATGTPGFTSDFTGLISVSITISGLPGVPSSTSFTEADLDQWVLTIGPGGYIADLNFFMNGAVNGDGLGIQGVDPSMLALYSGNTDNQIVVFQGHPNTREAAGIPALSEIGATLLALLIALAAAWVLARRVS